MYGLCGKFLVTTWPIANITKNNNVLVISQAVPTVLRFPRPSTSVRSERHATRIDY